MSQEQDGNRSVVRKIATSQVELPEMAMREGAVDASRVSRKQQQKVACAGSR